jgi:hypothetical protein
MRVCLLHDIFRAELFGQGGQNHTSAMLEQVLAPVLASLGHQLVRPPAFIMDRPPVLRDFAAAHGLAHDVGSWLRLYADPATLPLVRQVLREHVLAPIDGADLVLGWEMSPNMLRGLAGLGQKVIEFNLDSVRFCPDLFLRARSNDPAIVAWLDSYAVPDAMPRAYAAQLMASMPPPPPHPPATLFAGQVADDSSLIEGGAFARVQDHQAALAPDIGEILLLKPHPHGAPHPGIRWLHAAHEQARITPDNIYALLAAPFVRRVVTLTSSVATEAALFGKPAQRLVTPDQAMAKLPEFGAYRRLDARFLTPACWAALLGGRLSAAPPPPPIARLFSRPWGRFTAPPAIPSRQLAAGTPRHCGAGGDGLVHLGFGWAAPAAECSWTEGEFATLLLAPQSTRLRLTCRAATSLKLDITIRPGGQIRRIELGAQPTDIDLDLSPATVLELTLRPSATLALEKLQALPENTESARQVITKE